MTLPAPHEATASGFDDLQLCQELEDCRKHLEHAPVAALLTHDGHRAATELHELLGSLLDTAATERKAMES